MTAALLLLVPRTATLGALLYFAIVVNVALVTIGIGFQGTPVITVLMTLASLYLLCWEYDRWRPILPRWGRDGRAAPAFGRRVYLRSALAFGAAGAAAYGVALALGVANVGRVLGARGFPPVALLGAAFGLVAAWHARRMEEPPA